MMPYTTSTRIQTCWTCYKLQDPPGRNAVWHNISFYNVQFKFRNCKYGKQLKRETPAWQFTDCQSFITELLLNETAAKASRKKWPSNRIWHQPRAQGSRSLSAALHMLIWYSGRPRSVKRQNHLIKEEIKFRGGSRKKTLVSAAASLAEEFLSLTTCFFRDHKVLSWLQCVEYLQTI